ncbi:BQ5605_C016g08237 [Microbotryum silenes-dioicae]|uniref:BQ5605_C016g08237 protein n=1 Tax=Microbotryum silenes-dioicae TaxID=796604 RepID=A0A2X0MHE0_9BASI|nr:BQ5605_C016g08237 [Microbotryum silenes-dioicae]
MVKPILSLSKMDSLEPKGSGSDSDSGELKDGEKGGNPRRYMANTPISPTLSFRTTPRFAFDAPIHHETHHRHPFSRANSIAGQAPTLQLPVEFRTMTINVTETQTHPENKSESKNKDPAMRLADVEWHKLSSEEVCERLGVIPAVGLDLEMAQRRLAKDGKNVISPPPQNLPKKIFFFVFGGFGTLLFGAAVVCIIAWKPLGNPHPDPSNLALAIVLLIVIALQTFFNAWQDHSTGRAMASISGMLPSDVLVCRDGNTFKIAAADLVSGDIVKITLGSKVPADLRLIECSSDLRFDRSILTGESNPISATTHNTDPNFMESHNIALQGTLCLSGSGLGVCVALGDNTVFGRIAKAATGARPVKTSLEVEISRFVLIIGSLACVVALSIVIFWFAFLRRYYPSFISVSALLINCVSVAVAFVPEGLPVCVTVSLTVIAGSMKKKNIMCKTLSTVESLGSVDVICSDKTGTLTQNRMTVTEVVIGDSVIHVKEAQRMVMNKAEHPEGAAVEVLASIAGLCNDAAFESDDIGLPTHERKINGDATDTGLFRFAEDAVDSCTKLREFWVCVGKLAFNSKNKFAIKVFQPLTALEVDIVVAPAIAADAYRPEDYLMLVKGAPDVLMKRCSTYLTPDGNVLPLDEAAMAFISERQIELAGQGKRVLMLTKKLIRANIVKDNIDDEDALMDFNFDLTIVGLAALVDPLKDDTAETVRVCRGAGIRFMMVTGDMSVTAVSIARSAGIITTNKVHGLEDLQRDLLEGMIEPYDIDTVANRPLRAIALSGAELLTMTASQWAQVATFDEVVFARTSPQQKLQIVKTYQESGSTVALFGDGVNDAPALKQADVGVAVAGGSEVAMEAADLILLDDFSAIVVGIESGRLCFENLRKSILYLLPAGSFSELMPVLLNVFFGLPQVLSNIQMILICAVTDVLPALSLCYEKPEADLLSRKPRNRKKERLADAKLICHAYFFLGIIESLTSLVGAFYFGFQRKGVPFSSLWLNYSDAPIDPKMLAHAQSIYFFNLVIIQWFNLLSTRTRRLSIFSQPPWGSERTRNYRLFPAMVAALLLAVFFSTVPLLQRVLKTATPGIEYYGLPLGYGVAMLTLDEVRKAINRRYPKGLMARVAW